MWQGSDYKFWGHKEQWSPSAKTSARNDTQQINISYKWPDWFNDRLLSFHGDVPVLDHMTSQFSPVNKNNTKIFHGKSHEHDVQPPVSQLSHHLGFAAWTSSCPSRTSRGSCSDRPTMDRWDKFGGFCSQHSWGKSMVPCRFFPETNPNWQLHLGMDLNILNLGYTQNTSLKKHRITIYQWS